MLSSHHFEEVEGVGCESASGSGAISTLLPSCLSADGTGVLAGAADGAGADGVEGADGAADAAGADGVDAAATGAGTAGSPRTAGLKVSLYGVPVCSLLTLASASAFSNSSSTLDVRLMSPLSFHLDKRDLNSKL
jgi:hypothetical protein